MHLCLLNYNLTLGICKSKPLLTNQLFAINWFIHLVNWDIGFIYLVGLSSYSWFLIVQAHGLLGFMLRCRISFSVSVRGQIFWPGRVESASFASPRFIRTEKYRPWIGDNGFPISLIRHRIFPGVIRLALWLKIGCRRLETRYVSTGMWVRIPSLANLSLKRFYA